MPASNCTCPTCHLIFAADCSAGPVACPVCDTRFTPGAPAPAAPPLPATPQASGHQAPLLFVAAVLLAGGLGLAFWWPAQEPSRKRAALSTPVAEKQLQPRDLPDTPDPVEPPRPVPDQPLPSAQGQAVVATPRRPVVPAPKRPVVSVVSQPSVKVTQRPPMPGVSWALARRVNEAIDRGLAYLRNPGGPVRHRQRSDGLLGLTLLECGVPGNDPLVREIAASLRTQAPRLNQTYELSTAIFFFDRLGQQQDEQWIRIFADRLAAGQSGRGTWTYTCPLSYSATPPPSQYAPGDHSNTQFATLALWIARRHRPGPQVREALARVEEHFRAIQVANGSWGYHAPPAKMARSFPGGRAGQAWDGFRGPNWNADPRRSWTGFDAGKPPPPAFGGGPGLNPFDHPLGKKHFPMLHWPMSNTCAGLLALAVGHGIGNGRSRPLNDAGVTNALSYLGNSIGNHMPMPHGQGGPVLEGRADLYTLWSIERVGTLYSLQRIGPHLWYPWAAEWLVDEQQPNGSWQHGLGSVVDTCFALLILKRSNLAPDLTYALRNPGKRPPATPRRLNEGVASTASAKRLKQGVANNSGAKNLKQGVANNASGKRLNQGVTNDSGSRRGLTNPGTAIAPPAEPQLQRGLQEPAAAPKTRDQKTP